jgi:hypothetical protein
VNDATRLTRLIDDVRGARYGEVIAVFARHGHFEAEVFGTQFLNDCPQDLWDGLDASAIASSCPMAGPIACGPWTRSWWSTPATRRRPSCRTSSSTRTRCRVTLRRDREDRGAEG